MAADLNERNDVWPRVAALDTTLAAKVYPVVRLALLDLEARLAALEGERGRAGEGASGTNDWTHPVMPEPIPVEAFGDSAPTWEEAPDSTAGNPIWRVASRPTQPSPSPSGIGEEPESDGDALLRLEALLREARQFGGFGLDDVFPRIHALFVALLRAGGRAMDEDDAIRHGIHDNTARFNTAFDGGRAEQQRAEPVAWRPIESAPKDGTTVIVGRHSVIGWVLGYARWESVVTGLRYGTDPIEVAGWISHGFTDPPGNLGLAHPTHWQHLPAPPGAVAGPRCNCLPLPEPTSEECPVHGIEANPTLWEPHFAAVAEPREQPGQRRPLGYLVRPAAVGDPGEDPPWYFEDAFSAQEVARAIQGRLIVPVYAAPAEPQVGPDERERLANRPEGIASDLGQCQCDEAYTSRNLRAPNCTAHDGDVEELRAAARLLRGSAPTPPACATCGKPAACLGRYECRDTPEYACNECCGHGNEDGVCLMLPGAAPTPETREPATTCKAPSGLDGVRCCLPMGHAGKHRNSQEGYSWDAGAAPTVQQKGEEPR